MIKFSRGAYIVPDTVGLDSLSPPFASKRLIQQIGAHADPRHAYIPVYIQTRYSLLGV